MTSQHGAVFLSYASEDSEAAGRIAEALRAGGVEVWFDRSELRGGDVWDRKIGWSSRDVGIFFLLYDPFVGRYRNDPHFAAFCLKVGLPRPQELRAP